jgi:hypothetical protein
MAQPEYVPTPVGKAAGRERLPTPLSWRADRPGELVNTGGQPVGPGFGVAGPDQGYALKLVRLWEDQLIVPEGEHREDIVAGCLGVATKRAAEFGRAPVTYDVEIAFTVWGYLGQAPPADLVAYRRPLFAGCAHDYEAQRAITDVVPDETLRLSPDEVKTGMGAGGWKTLLGVA